jgi:hypothetical protein
MPSVAETASSPSGWIRCTIGPAENRNTIMIAEV